MRAEPAATKLTDQFGCGEWRKEHGEDALVVLTIDDDDRVKVATADRPLDPQPGETLLALVREEKWRGPGAAPGPACAGRRAAVAPCGAPPLAGHRAAGYSRGMGSPPTPDELHALLHAFFEEVTTLGLATVDDRGRPHAANVNFCADEALDLYFLSSPDSAHGRHIAARPHVAATAYAAFEGPSEIRGVQVHGTCEAVPESAFDALWVAFCRKFPYAARFAERARAGERIYRLRPTWMKWTDNAVHFGYKLASRWPPRSGPT